MRRERFAACGVVAAIAASLMIPFTVTQSVSADVVAIESFTDASTEKMGQFTGSLEYEFDAVSMTGLLTVTLTNTTDMLPESSLITGFVFNINSSDPNASSMLTSATHNQFVNLANEKAPPFGMQYDAGAALGGMWTGGGNPNPGVAPGDTGIFTFEINASDASMLNAANFLEGQLKHNFVVRFRGGDFSDKVPAQMIVPAPAALAVFVVAGLCGTRRRR